MKIPFLPYTEWQEPCGFQSTFFECPPDHSVTRRAYGWTRKHSAKRAAKFRERVLRVRKGIT